MPVAMHMVINKHSKTMNLFLRYHGLLEDVVISLSKVIR